MSERRSLWRKLGFVAVNVWLVFHLTAIAVTPATVGPSSQSARRVWEVVGPYLQVLYLNHGYHYFAPEPGSSHLLAYTLHFADGHSVSGRIPNLEITPRLLYHRHFMLTEVLGNSNPDQQAKLAHTFAQQLTREFGAESVTLKLVEHDLSMMPRIRAGGRLDDADLYREQLLGTFRRGQSE